MTPQEYNNLPLKNKAEAKESYLDGYKAAIDLVKSISIKIGVNDIDQAFIYNRNMIITILESNHKVMTQAPLVTG